MGSGGKLAGVLLLGSLVVGATGCGSSSSRPKPPANPAVGTTTAGGAAVTTGSVHATFQGASHNPTVGKPWAYSVHVSDAGGHPLSGTVRIQFTFSGQVVGTDHPPVHPVRNGSWHDTLTFPKAAVGQPLTLQAVVHTGAGSVTLNWPITARQ
jgi:hypothetical protein